MNIGWIEISIKRYGGNLYNQLARDALAGEHSVELVSCEAAFFKSFRPLKLLESLVRLAQLQGEKDIWIRDFYSTLTMPLDKTKGKNMVVLHHVDFSGFSFFERAVLSLFEKFFFYRNLRKADIIVTISEYWRRCFLDRGYKNVYKIYPGVDTSEFHFTEEEVSGFRKKHGLEGKPIIYLGNCQKAKGVVEACNALKDMDAHLVTSGRRLVSIPAKNLDLAYRDYLLLLKSASVALTMSKFKEGWCITAQEAMLCNTPVIGSGSGGMRELLEGGGQMICEDFKNLREKVEYVLSHPEVSLKMGEQGHAFARQFTLERFQSDWIKLFEHI